MLYSVTQRCILILFFDIIELSLEKIFSHILVIVTVVRFL